MKSNDVNKIKVTIDESSLEDPSTKPLLTKQLPGIVADKVLKKRAKDNIGATASELESRKEYIGGSFIGEKNRENTKSKNNKDLDNGINLGATIVSKVHESVDPEISKAVPMGQIANAISGSVLDISGLISEMQSIGLLDANGDEIVSESEVDGLDHDTDWV